MKLNKRLDQLEATGSGFIALLRQAERTGRISESERLFYVQHYPADMPEITTDPNEPTTAGLCIAILYKARILPPLNFADAQ